MNRTRMLTLLLLATLTAAQARAQQLEIPRRHDRPPGPPLSAQEAAAKMTVPEGFTVEVVAAEPDVVNPVAMFIDEKGRYWITESFEYPRKEPGPGKDRIKVLEDTNGDGKVDKVTLFAEGLNIPSGIAVGYGGVWVCNSPDILFMQDTDGDLKADKTEVVVTGFGRTDTHELPNSLTWGPDGWLYGLNGVFNYSKVKYAPTNPQYEKNKDKIWEFTCAMFRIHPRTREFQIFAEGTSNPWGIAINDEGDFFISACVIDHLWHIVETGYYIRQGGPYPPHTWPIGSIVDYKHQKAAYCGITWFDSDAYPEEYRKVLYMGNIHGGCINADRVERNGSTYKGKPHPGFKAKPDAWKDDQYNQIAKTGDPNNPKLADFLTANDAWFMPVVQKTGPDGCLYILDWYDRYHCYQDANADPAGIERAKGRLYRVRYKDTPHAQPFDLAKKSADELIELLLNGRNEYERETAQQLLAERLGRAAKSESILQLEGAIRDPQYSVSQQLRALWTLASSGRLTSAQCASFMRAEFPVVSRWALRFGLELAASQNDVAALIQRFPSPQAMPSPLNLQLAITFSKTISRLKSQPGETPIPGLLATASRATGDQFIEHIVWQNLIQEIGNRPGDFARYLQEIVKMSPDSAGLDQILVRSLGLLCDLKTIPADEIAQVLSVAARRPESSGVWEDSLNVLADRIRTKPMAPTTSAELHEKVAPLLKRRSGGVAGTILLALWNDSTAQSQIRAMVGDRNASDKSRILALQTLIAANAPQLLEILTGALENPQEKTEFRAAALDIAARINRPEVGEILLRSYGTFEPDVQPKAIEVLTQRPAWSLALLQEISAGKIDKSVLNFNQLTRVNTFKDDELKQLVAKTYGAVRAGARSDRQGVINKHKDFLRGTPGDPFQGALAFKKICAQCHKLYGEGAEVGPDITRNGRNNWDQLLQNVFDPSAVIGPGYQARMLATTDGRVLTGLPVEESEERVVLKIQGGKIETIPRDQIEQYKVSELSMMPEDVEKLLTPQEIADLFAYLALDRPPSDPEARLLPGAPEQKRRN